MIKKRREKIDKHFYGILNCLSALACENSGPGTTSWKRIIDLTIQDLQGMTEALQEISANEKTFTSFLSVKECYERFSNKSLAATTKDRDRRRMAKAKAKLSKA